MKIWYACIFEVTFADQEEFLLIEKDIPSIHLAIELRSEICISSTKLQRTKSHLNVTQKLIAVAKSIAGNVNLL
jgi:hypothetical protein